MGIVKPRKPEEVPSRDGSYVEHMTFALKEQTEKVFAYVLSLSFMPTKVLISTRTLLEIYPIFRSYLLH